MLLPLTVTLSTAPPGRVLFRRVYRWLAPPANIFSALRASLRGYSICENAPVSRSIQKHHAGDACDRFLTRLFHPTSEGSVQSVPRDVFKNSTDTFAY